MSTRFSHSSVLPSSTGRGNHRGGSGARAVTETKGQSPGNPPSPGKPGSQEGPGGRRRRRQTPGSPNRTCFGGTERGRRWQPGRRLRPSALVVCGRRRAAGWRNRTSALAVCVGGKRLGFPRSECTGALTPRALKVTASPRVPPPVLPRLP